MEHWKPVPNLPDRYEVSDLGRVRNSRTGRVLKQHVKADAGGYLAVNLHHGSGQRKFVVHRLVLRAFVGEPPAGREACHGPRGHRCNWLTNLRWDTPTANIAEHWAMMRGMVDPLAQ